MDQVSVGRIVRYVLTCGRIVAAIVTEVFTDNTVSLTVFPPPSANDLAPTVQKVDVKYDQSATPGTWHWPARLDARPVELPRVDAELEPVTLEKNIPSQPEDSKSS